ncbi:tetratricopeptide repeat protein [Xylanibacter oryzae]|uniref:tetratricopeptide repeat protein n=1 Tax=Xylanibacter oryzae TaxID=185293 RepID=UPI0004BB3452|nr:tetratricopeptide repeat protein [Xylanibacter oryzae]
MNFFKALFGGKIEDTEKTKKEEELKNFDLIKYDGVKALKTGQNEYAIKCFKKAIEIKNTDLEIRDYLARAYVAANEPLKAFEQLQKLAEAQPDNQKIFVQMAHVTFMMEDYGAMADSCERALLIDKDNAEVSYLYAKACIGQGDDVNAVAMLTKAILLKDDYGDAYLLRGETLLKMGDYEGSDADAKYLLEKQSDNESVLILKARIEHKLGNNDEAINYYNKVVDVNPFSIDAFRERGAVKLEVGDKDGAAEDMQQVLELDPKQTADINGEFSAEGVEEKTKQAYNKINPFGL